MAQSNNAQVRFNSNSCVFHVHQDKLDNIEVKQIGQQLIYVNADIEFFFFTVIN